MSRLVLDAAVVFDGTVLAGLAGVGLVVLCATLCHSPASRAGRAPLRHRRPPGARPRPTAVRSRRDGAPPAGV
jgi:hypothetical protein